MKKVAKILVPIDFSEASLEALDGAIEWAAALGASVVAMHAYELPVVALFPEAALVSSAAETGHRIAMTAEGALRDAVQARLRGDVHVEVVLREGPVSEQIDAVADEVGADLIVLGAHTGRGLFDWLVSGVAEKVVRTARRPVLTIHGSATRH
jgi:nucleotide-binding universal stress UspA family protein